MIWVEYVAYTRKIRKQNFTPKSLREISNRRLVHNIEMDLRQSMKVWAGSKWPKTRPNFRLLWTRLWIFEFHESRRLLTSWRTVDFWRKMESLSCSLLSTCWNVLKNVFKRSSKVPVKHCKFRPKLVVPKYKISSKSVHPELSYAMLTTDGYGADSWCCKGDAKREYVTLAEEWEGGGRVLLLQIRLELFSNTVSTAKVL